jgi:hypothetical protein
MILLCGASAIAASSRGDTGTQREHMTSSTDVEFDVWGFENYEAIAVDEHRTVVRFDSAAQPPMMSGTDGDLLGAWDHFIERDK